MDSWQLTTPVVIIIFNRPEPTARVFEAIATAKPSKLFVIADGPRPNRPGEADRCEAARSVFKQIDWDCELFTDFADTNLGCQHRVVSGLNRVFNTVEQAIIFEDDCLPHPTFFRFCEELLDKYQGDERIMHISGNNFQFDQRRTSDSYYYSQYTHNWGWATWRRAWQHFDAEMKLWPEVRETNRLKDILPGSRGAKYWSKSFQELYDDSEKRASVWDAQWLLTCWLQHGLSILPNVNLVSNIGFDADATHTLNKWSRVANLPVEAMPFPLQHPPFVIRDTQADNFTDKVLYQSSFVTRTAKRIAKKILGYK